MRATWKQRNEKVQTTMEHLCEHKQ